MTQLTVNNAPDLGIPGQVSTLHSARNAEINSKSSEEASASVPFGVVVKQGTADDGVKLLTSTADRLVGIVVFGQSFSRTFEIDSNGIRPGVTFGVMSKGRIWVRTEDAVTPASEVHVRAVGGGANGYGTDGVGTAEQVGAVRGTADGVKCIDITPYAKFVRSAAAKSMVEIDVDFTNVALGVAD